MKNYLHSFEIFNDLSNEEIELFTNNINIDNYKKDETIINEGEEGNSLLLTLVKSISNDENRFKRVNVQKIGSLKALFNSPINEVSFNVKTEEDINEISKMLNEDGKTAVNISLTTEDKILKFKLKNLRDLDRKSLNLLRKREISSTIS